MPDHDEPLESPGTESIRIHADLVEMVRFICLRRKKRQVKPSKITDYIDSILRGPILRDHDEEERLYLEAARKKRRNGH